MVKPSPKVAGVFRGIVAVSQFDAMMCLPCCLIAEFKEGSKWPRQTLLTELSASRVVGKRNSDRAS